MKNLMKSLLVLVVALSLVVSLFTGCGKVEEDVTGSENEVVKEKEAAKETPKKEASDITEEAAPESLEHVTLKWYYIGGEQPDEEAVFAAANEIIEAEINATVEFIRLGWGDYEQKMQLMTAAGEEYDLAFSAGWINNYKSNVESGAYMVLDDLLFEYAPKTMETHPDNITDGTRIGGHLYGIPGLQVAFRQMALIFNKELVDKYDMKDDIFKIKDLDDLTPFLQIIKENEPDKVPVQLSNDWEKFHPFTEANYLHRVLGPVPIFLDYDGNVSSALDPEARAVDEINFARASEWMKKGYFHQDVGMGLKSDFSAEKEEAKFFVMQDVNKPGVEADMLQRYGYEVYAVPIGMSTISTGSITSNMTVVSNTSKNPERAVMLLEVMNNNVDLYNLIVFGLEGQHYTKTGENRVEVTDADGYSGMAWMMGNQFNAYILPAQSDDVWEVTKKLNKEALSSPDLGFYFDDDKVKTELANCTAVYKEYREILHFGIVENYSGMIEERNAKLADAGLQIVVDEMQAQVDAWK